MVYLNGEFIAKADAKISVMDRGFLFGDGVYEVIPVYQRRIFRLDAHLHRLQKSLDALKISNPYSPEKWLALIEVLLGDNPNDDQSIYLQITRGADQKRAHRFNELTPSVYIESNPLIAKTQQQLTQGFSAITQEDIRWGRCDIKATSLLANVLYSQQAQEANVEEVILHRDGLITEGASSNVFMIKGDTLFTHPTNQYILAGITRDLVLESAKACQIKIEESGFSKQDLTTADELWISSSTREVMPITRIDAREISQGKIGQHWRRVYQYYQQLKHD